MIDNATGLNETRAWVERFVVAHDICPFARRERERDSIRYVAVSARPSEPIVETVLLALVDECQRLDDEPGIETTLLVVTRGMENFDDYLDLLGLVEALLEEQGYEGIYQLASFHPDYCFDGVEESDPANYTNRSPYPMLHLLREASIERALASFPHPERIPERNVELLRKMGSAALTLPIDSARPFKSDN